MNLKEVLNDILEEVSEGNLQNKEYKSKMDDKSSTKIANCGGEIVLTRYKVFLTGVKFKEEVGRTFLTRILHCEVVGVDPSRLNKKTSFQFSILYILA